MFDYLFFTPPGNTLKNMELDFIPAKQRKALLDELLADHIDVGDKNCWRVILMLQALLLLHFRLRHILVTKVNFCHQQD